MKEKPDLRDDRIIDAIREAYGLPVTRAEFLPIGDISSAKYRLTTDEPAVYFLKLRKAGFKEISVSVPNFLREQGIRLILAPFKTLDGRLWTRLDDYTCILYPYIDGRNGFHKPLSDAQWIELGAALRAVHAACLPADLQEQFPRETYSPEWRKSARVFQLQAQKNVYEDPSARQMADILNQHQDEITFIIERAEKLAESLQSHPVDPVLCHTDIHAGNVLLEAGGGMHILDWDDPMLAPKERDLMFIGGGVGGIWNTSREEVLFYRGYGATEINWTALTYYRYERIIIDVVEFSRQLLATTAGGADRQRGLEKFGDTFSPGHVVDMAYRTDRELSRHSL
jgi:spectinomycin phosphotransferase